MISVCTNAEILSYFYDINFDEIELIDWLGIAMSVDGCEFEFDDHYENWRSGKHVGRGFPIAFQHLSEKDEALFLKSLLELEITEIVAMRDKLLEEMEEWI